jgi:hypothetical protein
MLEPHNQSVSVREYLFEAMSAVERDAWLQELLAAQQQGACALRCGN